MQITFTCRRKYVWNGNSWVPLATVLFSWVSCRSWCLEQPYSVKLASLSVLHTRIHLKSCPEMYIFTHNHNFLLTLPLSLQVVWASLPLSCARQWRTWLCSARHQPASTRLSARAESRIPSIIAPRTMWRKSARSVRKVRNLAICTGIRALHLEFVCAGIGNDVK